VAESKSTATTMHTNNLALILISSDPSLVNSTISTFRILFLNAVAYLSRALAGFLPVQLNTVMGDFSYYRRIGPAWNCTL